LILARNLSENKSNNLTPDQIESAEIIHRSGNDLLELINDILDLSKIEAGKMPVNITNVSVSEIADNIQYTFKHMISEKGLQLIVKIDPDIPKSIRTDKQRIEQITKNIIANAVKFTQRGGITIEFHKPTPVINLSKSGLNHDKTIGISIADTGIGIPKDKQLAIFEAFQQADGSTSRKFGGTGLGLSISRELTKLLGGEMQLVSELNQGSTFTIYLPFDFEPKEAKNETESKLSFIEQPVTIVDPFLKPQPIFDERIHATLPPSYVDDDRNSIQPDDRLILVIEDDMSFAKILLNQCHDKSFRCIAAQTGEDGLKLAEKYHPDAIILDIKLPGISGWAVLDTLKQNPNTMHIPIHMMSVEEAGIDAMHRGAVGFLTKPVKREDLESAFGNLENIIKKDIKDLLVVEDNQNLRKAIVQLISNNDVEITEASTGKEAIEALSNRQFDCMVLDLGLPDMTGYELLNQLHVDKAFKTPPVIIYTGKELTEDQERELNKYAESIIIKGAKSEERLLDETALFLHRVVRNMPHRMQQIIVNLHDKDRMFKDKKILLVDDDMRNVFAISKILTEKGIKVTKAEDGIKALKILEQDTDFDLILMDIMMPGLDGYETIQRIRQQNHLEKIPILALTAKAMKDDRDKCLAAGANDYLPKPVDIDRLFSMMRVWLYK